MHTRVPEIKSLMSLKTVPKLDTHSATVLHLLRQPVHRRGSDSNHGLGLDTLFIDTHEQNFIRRLLPLELELLLSCTTTKTPNTWKRYPIPSYSKWRLKNIYPNTLKWVTNARNWKNSLLATSKSIHFQNSQHLSNNKNQNFNFQTTQQKIKSTFTIPPSNQLFIHKCKLRLNIPSALKNLSLLRLSE